MQAELEALEAGLGNPERPVIAVVGGAKVSTKLDLLKNLVQKVDALVIGGGMANTFLLALGHDMGKSLVEADMVPTAKAILAKADEVGCRVVLPTDAVVAAEFKANPKTAIVPVTAVPTAQMMLDVGPASAAALLTAAQLRTPTRLGLPALLRPLSWGLVAIAGAWAASGSLAISPQTESGVFAFSAARTRWRSIASAGGESES